MTSHFLQWPDYLVFVSFLLISLAIGFYHALTGGKQKTTKEFIMANRTLGVIPAAISLLVSFLSAVTMLGTTAEMYAFGAQYMLMANIAIINGTILAAIIFVPWMHSLKLTSVNEYLNMRFQARSVMILGSVFQMICAVIAMGAVMYAPSVALQSATGFPLWVAILVMTIVSVTYTSMGGMRAVIWTDVFQFGIMMVGLGAILIKGIIVVGGVGRVAELSAEGGRLVWTDWNPDPTTRHTAWGFLIGWTFMCAIATGITQASVQRFSATETVSKGRLVILLSVPGMVLMNVLACCIGLVVYAFYADKKCDPLANKDIHSRNQLLPYFVTTMFAIAPGFTGLFLATLYGGSLSTVSTILSGCAANLWEDILKHKLSWLAESKQALINRLLVVLFGLLATGMAFVSSVLPGTIIQVTVMLSSSISGPISGLFLLGGLTKHANWKGALIGVTAGLTFSIFLTIGASVTTSRSQPPLPSVSLEGCLARDNMTFSTNWTEYRNETQLSANRTYISNADVDKIELDGLSWFFSISYVWYMILGSMVTFIVGCLASLAFRDREFEDNIDERLLMPIVRRFYFNKQRQQRELLKNVTLLNNNCEPITKENGHKCAEDLSTTKRLLPPENMNGNTHSPSV